jgi:hypothetical protein
MLPSPALVDRVTLDAGGAMAAHFRDKLGARFILQLQRRDGAADYAEPQLLDCASGSTTTHGWRHAAILIEQLAYLIHRDTDRAALNAMRDAIAASGRS